MPTGSIQVYASVAGQAAPLAGVQVAVLDESGVTVAHLTTDEAGAAEATNLTAPNASYSLQETNTTVRPYAVYRLRADASGWQSQILDGVQVFDGQQTVARLEFLPGGGDGNALPAREAAPHTVTIPPHVLFAGDGGSGQWSRATLHQMLTNRTYAGDLEQGRRRKISYKSARSVRLPRSQWIVVPGTHEGLVSRADFAAVQARLARRGRGAL